MNTESLLLSGHSRDASCGIAIAATFTAEPVEEVLAFWMSELSLRSRIEFSPYNQVFQQLIDPDSLLGRNRKGVNILLIRVEDWQRLQNKPANRQKIEEDLGPIGDELINAVRMTASRSSTPLILGLCPPSPATMADQERRSQFAKIERQISVAASGISSVVLIQPDDFDLYKVDAYYDSERDQLGHIPYTPLFYAALGTILARKIHSLISLPYKVIVLDCDNTLWKGVIGEDGIDGITIPRGWDWLQQFMVELAGKGMLLCLCSKNEESDVLDVLARRPDMVLKRDHLVSWRINWMPKSENIKSLAQELNLGLNSFIFLDDNPVECAEVRSGCPEVLTLRLPIEKSIPEFLKHVWVFDRPKVTAEDQQRTVMYKQEMERARFQEQSVTIADFLAGLDLQVDIADPTPSQLPRVAQLTQRTNQFNFTTVRRTDGEIEQLSKSGLECRAIEVSDRFGDYGLVGVMIFSTQRNALEIDTFLLSCRVLGRGVEHRMLRHLGEIARDRQLSQVTASFIPTKKNMPARNFLDSVAASFRQQTEPDCRYAIPAEAAATIAYTSEATRLDDETTIAEVPAAMDNPLVDPKDGPQRFERIATEHYLPEQVLETLHVRSGQRRERFALHRPFVAPRNEIESALTELWAGLLRTTPVGINDNFFDLGGTSLLSVDLFAQIERQFGKRLPLTALIEAPTIEQLTRLIAGVKGQDSLVLIRGGGVSPRCFSSTTATARRCSTGTWPSSSSPTTRSTAFSPAPGRMLPSYTPGSPRWRLITSTGCARSNLMAPT